MGRTVEEIQAEIRAGAERLEALMHDLELSELRGELERLFPDDTDAMWKDDVCPSLAYEIHGDLSHLAEHLDRASEIMRLAASRTRESSLDAWRRRQLESVEDHSVKSLLRYLLEDPSGPRSARG